MHYCLYSQIIQYFSVSLFGAVVCPPYAHAGPHLHWERPSLPGALYLNVQELKLLSVSKCAPAGRSHTCGVVFPQHRTDLTTSVFTE